MGMIALGLRNLLRNKLRLGLVVALIGVPFFLLLATQSISNAIVHQTNVLREDVNTLLQVRARGSMGHINMVGQDRILPQRVLQEAENIEGVVEIEPYLLAMAPITPPNFVMLVGLDPLDTKRLESHGEAGMPRVTAGRDFVPEDRGRDVAVIGQSYAEWAGITAEQVYAGTATLVVDPGRSSPVIFALDRRPRQLEIIGIYASGYVFGDLQLFMPMETFRDIYGIAEGISWLFVRASSVDEVASVERELRGAVGDVADVVAPTQAAEFTATTSRTVLQVARTGGVLSLALMVIVVFFVMLLHVRERASEVGTLKAIGASDRGIGAQFLTEAVAFALLGGLAGLLLFGVVGAAITEYLFRLGIGPFLPSHYQPLFDSLAVSFGVSAAGLGLVLVVSVVAAVIGSAYGLWQIIKLSPLEAIKHE